MIFYFSGTGNSRWVANALGITLGEPVVSMAEELKQVKRKLSARSGKMRKCCLSIRYIHGDRLFLSFVLSKS